MKYKNKLILILCLAFEASSAHCLEYNLSSIENNKYITDSESKTYEVNEDFVIETDDKECFQLCGSDSGETYKFKENPFTLNNDVLTSVFVFNNTSNVIFDNNTSYEWYAIAKSTMNDGSENKNQIVKWSKSGDGYVKFKENVLSYARAICNCTLSENQSAVWENDCKGNIYNPFQSYAKVEADNNAKIKGNQSAMWRNYGNIYIQENSESNIYSEVNVSKNAKIDGNQCATWENSGNISIEKNKEANMFSKVESNSTANSSLAANWTNNGSVNCEGNALMSCLILSKNKNNDEKSIWLNNGSIDIKNSGKAVVLVSKKGDVKIINTGKINICEDGELFLLQQNSFDFDKIKVKQVATLINYGTVIVNGNFNGKVQNGKSLVYGFLDDSNVDDIKYISYQEKEINGIIDGKNKDTIEVNSDNSDEIKNFGKKIEGNITYDDFKEKNRENIFIKLYGSDKDVFKAKKLELPSEEIKCSFCSNVDDKCAEIIKNIDGDTSMSGNYDKFYGKFSINKGSINFKEKLNFNGEIELQDNCNISLDKAESHVDTLILNKGSLNIKDAGKYTFTDVSFNSSTLNTLCDSTRVDPVVVEIDNLTLKNDLSWNLMINFDTNQYDKIVVQNDVTNENNSKITISKLSVIGTPKTSDDSVAFEIIKLNGSDKYPEINISEESKNDLYNVTVSENGCIVIKPQQVVIKETMLQSVPQCEESKQVICDSSEKSNKDLNISSLERNFSYENTYITSATVRFANNILFSHMDKCVENNISKQSAWISCGYNNDSQKNIKQLGYKSDTFLCLIGYDFINDSDKIFGVFGCFSHTKIEYNGYYSHNGSDGKQIGFSGGIYGKCSYSKLSFSGTSMLGHTKYQYSRVFENDIYGGLTNSKYNGLSFCNKISADYMFDCASFKIGPEFAIGCDYITQRGYSEKSINEQIYHNRTSDTYVFGEIGISLKQSVAEESKIFTKCFVGYASDIYKTNSTRKNDKNVTEKFNNQKLHGVVIRAGFDILMSPDLLANLSYYGFYDKNRNSNGVAASVKYIF